MIVQHRVFRITLAWPLLMLGVVIGADSALTDESPQGGRPRQWWDLDH